MTEDTYVYVLPAGEESPNDFEQNGILWTYDGQEILTNVVRSRYRVTKTEDSSVQLTRRDNLYGTLRVDKWGRRWIPADIDEDFLAMRLNSYDESTNTRDIYGDSLNTPSVENDGDDYSNNLWEEQDLSCTFYSNWTCNTCGGENVEFLYGTDSRTRATSMSTREAKTVYIVVIVDDTGEGNFCSGVFVDDYTVLTAAHCLYTSDGVQYDFQGTNANVSGYVCTKENYQSEALCSTINSIGRPGGYDISNNPIQYDYGLIHLDSNIGNGNWMSMSSESDSILEADNHYTAGSPSFLPEICTDNQASGGVYSSYQIIQAYRQSGDILYSPSGWFGTNLDGAVGQSGSGIWHFPNTSTTHRITMIMSRWKASGANAYFAGPKASDFRSWVISHMY